jgi:hypothetical protein
MTTVREIVGSGVPCDETQVDELEMRLGHKLPLDYRAFLLSFNGSQPRRRLFSVPDCGEAVVRVFTGIGTIVDIERWLRETAGDLTEGWLVVGFDQGGNSLIADPTGAIHYWDRALHFPASNRERNTFMVAQSFTAFLNGLRALPTE